MRVDRSDRRTCLQQQKREDDRQWMEAEGCWSAGVMWGHWSDMEDGAKGPADQWPP